MPKRKKKNFQHNIKKKPNLEDADTSETLEDKTMLGSAKNEFYDEIYDAPPAFKSDKAQGFVKWSELNLTFKIMTFLIPIVASIVWFFAVLNSTVTYLERDVTDIKQTTKTIAQTSNNNSNRLNHIENDLDEIKNNFKTWNGNTNFMQHKPSEAINSKE